MKRVKEQRLKEEERDSSVLHTLPVLTLSCTDLVLLPKRRPNISIWYSVSPVRFATATLRCSLGSTSSLGCPGSSAGLTMITKVSNASSSAVHVSRKLSGVTSETRRAWISGSASGRHGKFSFLLCQKSYGVLCKHLWKYRIRRQRVGICLVKIWATGDK